MTMMKKMIMRSFLALCIGFIITGQAAAQPYGTANSTGTNTLMLSLDDAIRIALDENPTIKVADLEIERQKYVRKETVGNHLPQLSIDGTYNRAIVKSDMGGGVSFDPTNTVNAAASLTIPLFAPGVYRTLRLNDEQMRAAVEDARGSRITLVNEVKKAYYNILLAEESLTVLKASEANVAETVQDTKTKFENGLASEYDYITADVQLSNLRPTIIQTENSIDVAKKLLKMYLGFPLEIDIEVTGNINSMMEASENAIFSQYDDVSTNSDLRAMDIQVQLLRRQLDVLKTQRMPTVAAFGSFNLAGRDPLNFGSLLGGGGDGSEAYSGTMTWADANGNNAGSWSGNALWTPAYNASAAAAASSSSSFFWTNPVSAGVSVSIPLFAGFTNKNREKQLKYNISQVRLQRDYLEESTRVQLNNSRNAVITAYEMMLANEHTISQAQKGYDISRTRYDAEVGTMLEVNSAELALTQAKLNYTQAVYDYLTAQADYEKIIGKEE